MAPPCKSVKRGAVRANDLTLRNDLEAWPDSSVGRALDVQSQGSRVRIRLGSVISSHFHFSFLPNPVAFTKIFKVYEKEISFRPLLPQEQTRPKLKMMTIAPHPRMKVCNVVGLTSEAGMTVNVTVSKSRTYR